MPLGRGRGGGGRTARHAAMDLLARREHGPRELKDKLARRGYAAEEIEPVLAALEREGLMSPARLAEAVIASHVRRGQGPVRIRAALEQQGLDREAIASALAGCGIDFAAEARGVRQRRFGENPPANAADRSRQLRFLQYRGFSAADAGQALGPGADEDW